MKRMITTLALAATMMLATASLALADFPAGENPNEDAACEETVDTANHGEHIIGYVATYGNAGGGRPAHFGGGDPFSPGASFCQGDNSAPFLSSAPPHGG